jgi:hypothetical protein
LSYIGAYVGDFLSSAHFPLHLPHCKHGAALVAAPLIVGAGIALASRGRAYNVINYLHTLYGATSTNVLVNWAAARVGAGIQLASRGQTYINPHRRHAPLLLTRDARPRCKIRADKNHANERRTNPANKTKPQRMRRRRGETASASAALLNRVATVQRIRIRSLS